MLISQQSFFVLCVLVVSLHCMTMRAAFNIGTAFYKHREHAAVWDVMHAHLPDYSKHNHTKNAYLLVFCAPLLFTGITPTFAKEFALKFALVVLLRSLATVTTILPKNPRCTCDNPAGLLNVTVQGTCYDKMFSGHFAFGLLLTVLMFKHRLITPSVAAVGLFALLNCAHVLILGATRAHFTQDVVVSIYVTLLVVLLPISIK